MIESYKLKKEWVESWPIEYILKHCVSMGIELAYKKIDSETLDYNRNLLLEVIKEKYKSSGSFDKKDK